MPDLPSDEEIVQRYRADVQFHAAIETLRFIYFPTEVFTIEDLRKAAELFQAWESIYPTAPPS